MLDIVASYHSRQFLGKRMIQTQEDGKKPNLRPDFNPLGTKQDKRWIDGLSNKSNFIDAV